MKLATVLIQTAAASLAAAQLYTIPDSLKNILAAVDCIMPVGFKVKSFRTWKAAQGNNHPSSITFEFIDSDTGIDTYCQWNDTSVSTDPSGSATRFACNNPVVNFIWSENNKLTMIESACPGASGVGSSEASGGVIPTLACIPTAANSTFGAGTACFAQEFQLVANFTSLEPTPPGPPAPPARRMKGGRP